VVEAGLLAKAGMNAAGDFTGLYPLCAVISAAQQATDPRTLGDFQAILTDHADYPHSICAHPEPAAHPCEQGQTIASLLMDLTAGQLWLAAGNPCQAPYEQLTVKL
jgi:hypothetical protein